MGEKKKAGRPPTVWGEMARKYGIRIGTFWELRKNHPGVTAEEWEAHFLAGTRPPRRWSGPGWAAVAKILGVSVSTVKRMRKRGILSDSVRVALDQARTLVKRRRETEAEARESGE